ncbi:hypothetical protein QZH41_009114 [Actinostola sp. cb2023]|nr:hypothetical protein QZH41_009114 [Actinostola sp. cb2023]
MGTTVRSENINVVPSSAIALCKHYMVEYNGEALWQWRNIEYHPVNYINALNETLKSIGYAICPTAHRIGEQLRTRNHTIAAIQTTESYDNLQQSLANIINDVNHLQDQGYIYVDGLKIKLELFLGGDYKFLLLCLGMKQATCTNACIYCKVDKDERQNMSKPRDFFCAENIRRELHTNWQKDPGCRHKPLFNIPLHHCIIDELHILLRITDRLEHALIHDAVDWDEV